MKYDSIETLIEDVIENSTDEQEKKELGNYDCILKKIFKIPFSDEITLKKFTKLCVFELVKDFFESIVSTGCNNLIDAEFNSEITENELLKKIINIIEDEENTCGYYFTDSLTKKIKFIMKAFSGYFAKVKDKSLNEQLFLDVTYLTVD